MSDVKLDVKDTKILYEMEKNCRQPLSILSKSVGLSREVVNYRLHQLEKKKIIEYYVTVVDYVKLGYVFCRVWFKYQNVSEAIEKKIVEFARGTPSINWIAVGDGLYNMVFVFLVKNLNTVEKDFEEFRFRFGKYILNITPSIAFKIYHFKHSYLYGNDDREPIIIGDSKVEELAEVDNKILGILVKKPRADYIELSKELKLSSKTISKKIDLLQKNGFIKQFKVKLNTNLLGFEHQKVMLFMKNLTPEKMQDVMNYLKFDPRVIFITKPFGISDLEFEIIVRSKKELFESMRRLMSKFHETITDYVSCLVYDEPFSRYLS